MAGKGSAPRPYSVPQDEYASNWDRIFSGHGREVQASGSNPDHVGSIPTAPAIYIDDESGSVVPETWWPGDPAPITQEETTNGPL